MTSRIEIDKALIELATKATTLSSDDLAKALIELYTLYSIKAASEEVQRQIDHAEAELKTQLQAQIASLTATANLTSQQRTPAVKEATPSPQEPQAPQSLETPAAPPAAPVQATELVQMEVEQPAPTPAAEPVAEPVAETAVQPAAQPTVQSPAPAAKEVKSEPVEKQASAPLNVVEKAQESGDKKSLNDRLAGKVLKFGLNDRIGFVKDLFDGSTEDFNRVVSQLNTLNTLQEAESFLAQHVAPEYNWDAQEETAERFILAVSQRFS